VSYFRRETLIETLARQTNWLIALREDDYYRLRPAQARSMNYIGIRSREESPFAVFRTDLPVQFPVASVPPDLFRLLLFRNDESFFGKWTADLMDSCDVIFYQLYPALKAGLTAEMFDRIGREMLGERERVHTELRKQLTRFSVSPAQAGQQIVWQEAGGQSLPGVNQASLPQGSQQGISWVQK
jgi:hypothetical protein